MHNNGWPQSHSEHGRETSLLESNREKRRPSALATPILRLDTYRLFRLGPCEKPVDIEFELLARILVACDVIHETPGIRI
jgi:hypothetical protein